MCRENLNRLTARQRRLEVEVRVFGRAEVAEPLVREDDVLDLGFAQG